MPWFDASFGSSKTGLVTVGYREVDNAGATVVARTTVGVVEIGGGGYGVDVVLNAATVTLEWDTGEATPIFAHENLEIRADANALDILYQEGVWIDTTGGAAAGTVLGVNGIQSNPVSNIADAITIAQAYGTKRFKLAGTIAPAASLIGYHFQATEGGGSVDANGQDLGGSIFDAVGITGTFASTSDMFGTAMAFFGTTTNWRGVAVRPGMSGTIVVAPGQVATFAQAASVVAGVSTPAIDVSGVGTQLNLRAYSGGMNIIGMDNAGSNASLEFTAGQVILAASNTAGTIVVRGIVSPITDNTAGATVITDAAVQGITINDTNLIVNTNLDVLVSSRATPADIAASELVITNAIAALNNISIADVQTALTNQGYTSVRALLLDNLDVAVSTRNSVVPMDNATSVAAHLATLNAIGALNNISVGDILTAVLTSGNTVDAELSAILALRDFIEGGRDIDFTGNDALGWQRIERDVAGTLIRRYNLFDELGSRINEPVSSFIARQGMISSEVAI